MYVYMYLCISLLCLEAASPSLLLRWTSLMRVGLHTHRLTKWLLLLLLTKLLMLLLLIKLLLLLIKLLLLLLLWEVL